MRRRPSRQATSRAADELDHLRGVDGDAADGRVGLDERGVLPDELAEVGAPLLEVGRLGAAPVHDRRRARSPRRAAPGTMRMMSSSWIGLKRFGRSGCTGTGWPASIIARWNAGQPPLSP